MTSHGKQARIESAKGEQRAPPLLLAHSLVDGLVRITERGVYHYEYDQATQWRRYTKAIIESDE